MRRVFIGKWPLIYNYNQTMNIQFTLSVLAILLVLEVLSVVIGLLLRRYGHGIFTWKGALVNLLAFVVAGLAIGFFQGNVMAVSSSGRMTYGMLSLVALVAFVGTRFILKGLWK